MRKKPLVNGDKIVFQITPRKRRDGFTLGSTILLFPLWCQTLNEAVSYARYVGRDSGCEIHINDSRGNQIDLMEIDARHNRWMSQSCVTMILKRFSKSKTASRRRVGKEFALFQFIIPETA
jgi:hypothetical protein